MADMDPGGCRGSCYCLPDTAGRQTARTLASTTVRPAQPGNVTAWLHLPSLMVGLFRHSILYTLGTVRVQNHPWCQTSEHHGSHLSGPAIRFPSFSQAPLQRLRLIHADMRTALALVWSGGCCRAGNCSVLENNSHCGCLFEQGHRD